MASTDTQPYEAPSVEEVQPYVVLGIDDRTEVFTNVMNQYNKLFQLLNKEHRKKATHLFMAICINFVDVIRYRSNVERALRALMDDYIVKNKMHDLIPLYNKIFTDKRYGYLDAIALDVHIPIQHTELEYAKYMLAVKLRKPIKCKPRFVINEIIGAMDIEGNWWMSKVLHSSTYNEYTIYLIEYLNLGINNTEWIVESDRLARYNSFMHPYYRSAMEEERIARIDA